MACVTIAHSRDRVNSPRKSARAADAALTRTQISDAHCTQLHPLDHDGAPAFRESMFHFSLVSLQNHGESPVDAERQPESAPSRRFWPKDRYDQREPYGTRKDTLLESVPLGVAPRGFA